MAGLDRLPSFREAIERARDRALRERVGSGEYSLHFPFTGSASRAAVPRRGKGAWYMPVRLSTTLTSCGCVRCTEDGTSLVLFRDVAVVIQEIDTHVFAKRIGTAVDGDLAAPPSDIVHRCGDAWLTTDDVRHRLAPDEEDADGKLLVARLRDLLAAASAGPGDFIEAQRALSAAPAECEVHSDDDGADLGSIRSAAWHAVLCAGSAHRWWLRPRHPFRHLSSSWERTPRNYMIEPIIAPSATVRAGARWRAVGRTLSWLGATGATAEVIAAARGLAVPCPST